MGKFREFFMAEMATFERNGIEISTQANIQMLSSLPRRKWISALAQKYQELFVNPDGSPKAPAAINMAIRRALSRWIWASVGVPYKATSPKTGMPITGYEVAPEVAERYRNATAADLQPDFGIMTFPKHMEREEYSFDNPNIQYDTKLKIAQALGLENEPALDQYIEDWVNRFSARPTYGAADPEQRAQIILRTKQLIDQRLRRFGLTTGHHKQLRLTGAGFNQFMTTQFISAYREIMGYPKRQQVEVPLEAPAPEPPVNPTPELTYTKHPDLRAAVYQQLAKTNKTGRTRAQPPPNIPLDTPPPRETPGELLQRWQDQARDRKTGA